MGKYSLKPTGRGNAVQPRLESGLPAVKLPAMNILSRFLAMGALLTAAQSFAAGAFEGKISLTFTAERGRAANLDQSFKGQKVRMDMTAEGSLVSTIIDTAKMEMLILMPDQQMYMVMPMQKAAEQVVEKSGASTADIEVTGKTETILGYKCNQVLVKDKGTVTEAWIAEGLGAFMGMGGGGPMGGGMFGGGKPANTPKWESALKGKGGFPLRVITRDAKGKEIYKMEVTKIQPGSLPDSQFSAPAGYQKFAMPGMGG
jgi:hypothetical protein